MDSDLLAAARAVAFYSSWRVQLTIPSVLATGEEFSLRLTAFAPDGLPSEGFDREIVFNDAPGIEGLPKSVRFEEGRNGCMEIDGLTAVGPDRAWVVAGLEEMPTRRLYSNPAWVWDDPPWRLYWGDLHVHTTFGDCTAWCCKDPEFSYAFARDASHLDFCAMADHLHGIAADPARWPRLQELVREYDAPGRFVPILGFESSHPSGKGGDTNAYFLDADAPYFWLDRDDMKTSMPDVHVDQLWEFLAATGKTCMTIPHHTGREAKCRSFADPIYRSDLEHVFEVYSTWGSSESRRARHALANGNSEGPCYLQDALRAGCRYGVIASSDDHLSLPGGEGHEGRALQPKHVGFYRHHGLAAIRAKELTRQGLWDALTRRECYGTTFFRNLLRVRLGGVEMGGEVRVGPGDSLRKRRTIEVDVLGLSDPWNKFSVVLVRNGEEVQRRPWTLESGTVTFTDEDALDAVAIRDAPFHPDPFVVYYVRVDNELGDTQWSSPIWLDL